MLSQHLEHPQRAGGRRQHPYRVIGQAASAPAVSHRQRADRQATRFVLHDPADTLQVAEDRKERAQDAFLRLDVGFLAGDRGTGASSTRRSAAARGGRPRATDTGGLRRAVHEPVADDGTAVPTVQPEELVCAELPEVSTGGVVHAVAMDRDRDPVLRVQHRHDGLNDAPIGGRESAGASEGLEPVDR